MGRRKGFQSANGDAAIFAAAIEQALIKQGKLVPRPYIPPSAPIDRIVQLPSELRLQIYSFVFDKTTRLLVEDAPYASLIKLRRDERYVEVGQEEGPRVPEHLEEAIFRALEWTQSQGFTIRGDRRKPGPNEVMSEIIYELTGDRRCRKAVSTYMAILERKKRILCPTSAKGKQEPRVVKELPLTAKYAISLAEIAGNLFKLPAKATKDINEHINEIQKLASSLAEALRRDHTAILQEAMKASQMTKPNPALNGDVNIFRDLYNIKHNPKTPSSYT
ncbi:hypothetical protein OEA41_009403 [Lepraria neglecta]|uniref:TEA domain-containing protein n=1 Tax=Lepraria neglecta TaxID=209136 RepID=A0AAD9Z5T0_9LECA|nr:hypothetical protein OEA41_009403 [Lepraria neglecta]